MEVVLNKMFELMAFDPIYGDADDSDDDDSDDDDDSEKDDDDSDEDGSDEDDSDDDDDDDDDLSDDHTWRVRRAALRVISAFIRSRPEMLSTMYRRCVVAPDEDENSPGPLIARLSEHHQGVRIEVISTVRELFKRSSLRHRALLSARSGQDDGQDGGGMEEVLRSLRRSSASRAHKLLRQRSDHRVLSDRSDAIMKAVEKVLRDKKIAKNSSIVAELFLMLREWLVALGGQMPNVGEWVTTTQSIDRLVPRIVQSLTESKIDVQTRGTALEFLISLADSHGCDALRYGKGTKEYQLLVDGVTACSEADGYAIRCQTLRLLRSMVLRSKEEKEKQPMLHDLTFVQTICTTLVKHPEGVVKRCAVDTLSSLLEIGSTDAGVWLELNSALSSDSTGTTVMRAVSRILLSDSSSRMDSVSANGGVSSLTKLLRKSGTSRGARSSALLCVADIVAAFAPGGRGEGQLALEQQEQVLTVATNSIDVNDPHVSGIALRCLDSLLGSFASKANSSFLDEWNKSLREKIVGLSGHLEEGESLDNFCTFLRGISAMSEIDPIGLIHSIFKRSSERIDGMTTNSMIVVSRCIECLCSRDAEVLETTVRTFTATLSDPGKDGMMRTQLALYGLGEIGSRTNIEPYLSEKEKSGIESMFSVKEGELREASAWCLGSASTRSTDVLLPRILAFVRAGQGSSTTTALSCLRRALRLVSANADDMDRPTELDMSPQVHDILSTLRLHVFPNGSGGGASKSDGASQSEEFSTNHDVAVATECWGLLSTLPGIRYGVLSEEWTCTYDRRKGRKKYVKRVGAREGAGETSFDRPSSDKEVPSVPLISELVTTLKSDAAPPSHRCNAVVALSHVVSLLGSRRVRSSSDIVVEDVDDLRTTSEISGRNQSESAPGRLRDILSGVLERIVQLSSMSTVAAGGGGGEGKESSGVEGDLKTGEASLRLIGGLLRHHKSLLSGEQLHERIVPMLLERMKTLMEVEVNYGAFKMKDDRALPMRLAAFDCMETILGLLGGKMKKESLDELMDVLTASVHKMGADGKPKVLKKTGKIQMENLGVKDANQVRTFAFVCFFFFFLPLNFQFLQMLTSLVLFSFFFLFFSFI